MKLHAKLVLHCCYVATMLFGVTAYGGDQNVTIQNAAAVTIYNGVLYWSAQAQTSFAGTKYTTASGINLTVGSTYSSGTLANWGAPNYAGAGAPNNWWFAYYTNSGNAGNQFVVGPIANNGGPTQTLTATLPSAANPATNLCNITICARNNDVRYHVYSLWKDGVESNSTGNPGGLGIGAGSIGCYSFQVYCTNSTGWSLNYSSAELALGYQMPVGSTNYTISTNSAAVYPSATNNVTAVDPVVYSPGQTNIIWTAAASTNAILSQQQGSEAIKNAIDVGNVGLLSALSNLSGAITGTGTNQGTDSGVTNAIDRFRQQNTNLLSQILTNLQNTNLTFEAGLTNSDLATAAGTAAASEVSDDVDGMLSAIGDAPGGALAGSGSSEVFSFAFMGETINLDPEVHFPGVMGIAKILLTAIVMILFALDISRMFYETVHTFTTAQTGGVPDLNAAGFNVAGAGAAVVVPIILIATWVVALVAIAAVMLTALGPFASAMTAAAGISLPAGAQYLLYATTPVVLIISLAFSRIVLWLTAAKAVMVAGAISRFLIGK